MGRVDAFNGVPAHVSSMKGLRCLTRKHAAVPRASLSMSDAPTRMETKLSNRKNKKVIVLGGDGFCGWPTCLHLSQSGDFWCERVSFIVAVVIQFMCYHVECCGFRGGLNG